MDHGPYPWVTQDASAAPQRAPPPPAPAGGMLSNPFAAPPPDAGQGPPRAPPNAHEAMDPFHALPGAAAAARAEVPQMHLESPMDRARGPWWFLRCLCSPAFSIALPRRCL